MNNEDYGTTFLAIVVSFVVLTFVVWIGTFLAELMTGSQIEQQLTASFGIALVVTLLVVAPVIASVHLLEGGEKP